MARNGQGQGAQAEDLSGSCYAITVEFDVADGAHEEFLRLVQENAAASLREEPGCRRFDVLSPEEDTASPGSVFLYEVYDNRPAFEAHLATPHYASFSLATEQMVRQKRVKHFRVSEGGRS